MDVPNDDVLESKVMCDIEKKHFSGILNPIRLKGSVNTPTGVITNTVTANVISDIPKSTIPVLQNAISDIYQRETLDRYAQEIKSSTNATQI